MCPSSRLPTDGAENESGARPIGGAATTIVLFIGWTRRGPTNKALPIQSWTQYAAKFGGLDPKSDLAYAVHHFFANGGSRAYVIRLKAPTRRGVIGPSDPSFQHAVLSQFDAGGHATAIDIFSIVCVPGLSDPLTLSALMSRVAARRAFLVADCPFDATVANVADTLPQGPARENAALYFPWVIARDPVSGVERHFPPSGFVCGIYTRTDNRHGVWQSPAGLEAFANGARRLSVAMTNEQNQLLNSKAVNCLRHVMPGGPVLWGARTLAGSDDLASDWKYVPVRRLALFIEQSLIHGTQWARSEPNEEVLWARLRLSVGAFLQRLFLQRAFKGQSPRDAYFVKCDSGTNSASGIAAGIVTVVVGFAPIKPAEFVTLKIEQRAGPADP